MENTVIKIDAIRTDGGTQPRATIDFEAVDDYMDAMADGAKFPPVVVFYDGSSYWLADGFHRVKAAESAGYGEIACEVHQGTRENAQWHSFGANRTNGLRRTNDDKQRAIKAALLHPMGAKKSNRQIANHIGVGETSVRDWREKLIASAQIAQIGNRTVTRKGTTYQQNTTNIGRKRQKTKSSNARRPRPKGRPTTTVLAVPETSGIPSSAGPLQQIAPQIMAPASTVPEPVPCPASTPQQSDPAGRLAAEWIARVHSALREIADCQITAKDLAASIRRRNSSDQLTKQLERIRDFIAAVLAEAGID